MVTGIGRVPKYEQRFAEEHKLAEQELAVLCVLMLRGPQTVGEIGRTNRAPVRVQGTRGSRADASSADDRSTAVRGKLPRQPGTKESRYAHLLAGEVQIEEREAATRSSYTP